MRLSEQWAPMLKVYAIGAGLADSATGLLLMSAPGLTLGIMRVPVPDEAALVYVRFIGAFVFGVGSLYFLALRARGGLRFSAHAPTVFLATAWMRLVVFAFVSIALVRHAMPMEWLSVPLMDGVLATLQFGFVSAGMIQEDVA